VKTLVFCTGKFYYELTAEKRENERKDVAIVRIEQLFPLHSTVKKNHISNADDYVWAQEEQKTWVHIASC
jgi:2-oxoglutarate dehydrogenase E1 component